MSQRGTKVITPNAFSDLMLTSSSVPENDYPVWSSVTTYAADALCIKNHRIWRSSQAANTNHDPLTAGPSWWMDIGPTNQQAMFDDVVGTATNAFSALVVVLRPGSVSGVALLELFGQSVTVEMRDAPAGTLVYSRTEQLDYSTVSSFYDWFFSPYEQKSAVVLTDLPWHFGSGELTVTVTGQGAVSCGVCKFGEVIELGGAEYGASLEIIDYSRKEKDSFGAVSIVERPYAKMINLSVLTNKSDLSRIVRKMAGIRATPSIYIAEESDPALAPLIAYGFYRSFRPVIEYPRYHKCALQIESLI